MLLPYLTKLGWRLLYYFLHLCRFYWLYAKRVFHIMYINIKKPPICEQERKSKLHYPYSTGLLLLYTTVFCFSLSYFERVCRWRNTGCELAIILIFLQVKSIESLLAFVWGVYDCIWRIIDRLGMVVKPRNVHSAGRVSIKVSLKMNSTVSACVPIILRGPELTLYVALFGKRTVRLGKCCWRGILDCCGK